MTVISIEKDLAALTLTVRAEFQASVEQVWRLWADPRKLERWWGPPSYPATVVEHRLEAGGRVRYFMTGPQGDKHHGYWDIITVDPPRSLEFRDGFADADGAPNTSMPRCSMRVDIEGEGSVARMVTVSTFESLEAMQKLIDMGVEEGLRAAMGQMDALID